MTWYGWTSSAGNCNVAASNGKGNFLPMQYGATTENTIASACAGQPAASHERTGNPMYKRILTLSSRNLTLYTEHGRANSSSRVGKTLSGSEVE